MIRLSVIIPTYNRASLLRATIDSVASATDVQIIVVDDGSTDSTGEMVAGYGDRVKFLCQQNRGPGVARNLGLSAADGGYVCFLDSDDLWFPWTADVYRRAIEENGRPIFVAGKPEIFEDAPPSPEVRERGLEVSVFADYYISGDQWRWFSASSFVMHRETFIAAGGFVEDNLNAEDADAALRMGVGGKFVQITSPATFAWRKHGGSLIGQSGKNADGVARLIDNELAGLYPGGSTRAQDRRRIITTYVRPLSLDLLKAKDPRGWQLYRRTFGWHVRLGRFKYLAGFLVRAVSHR